jgi:hypothetical protein
MAQANETWFYAGRRTARGGKSMVYAWVDADGEERYYKALAAGSTGASYTIDVTREGDRVTVAPRSLRFVESEAAPVDDVRGWRVEDAAAYHDIEAKKAERRAADSDEVQDALDVLRRQFKASKTYSAKWAFAQWVASEVARPPRGDR